jgi:hypothetical protein
MPQLNERPMPEFNPYAAPKADITTSSSEGSDGLRVEGNILVTPRHCTLPSRCVKCNAPMDGEHLVRKLYWHAQGWYFLLFFNLIIYAVAAMIVRKSATIYYGLCAEHRAARRRDMWIIAALLIGSPILGIMGSALDVSELWLVLPLAWLGAGIYAIVRTNMLRPVRIDEFNARVRGAGPAFLASIR